MISFLVSFFALLGSLCFLIASLGLFRMPDPLSRLHAATKASSLGVLLLGLSAIIRFPTPGVILLALAIIFLIFLTAPMACHAIAIRLLPVKDSP